MLMGQAEGTVKIGMLSFAHVHAPAYAQSLRELPDAELMAIADGAIGEVLAVKGTNHGSLPPGWLTDPALAGGGAVMDHTVHVADLLRWILEREFVSVYAEIDTLLHPGLPVDDCGTLLLEMEGGVFASLDPSWSRPRTFPTWGDV